LPKKKGRRTLGKTCRVGTPASLKEPTNPPERTQRKEMEQLGDENYEGPLRRHQVSLKNQSTGEKGREWKKGL